MTGLRAVLRRLGAVLAKEFRQMRRDRLTFGMMIGLPLVQLVLFGYAINLNPRDLPTALIDADRTVFSRSVATALETTGYFRIVDRDLTPASAERMIADGRALFVVTIPAGFGREVLRGGRPEILVEADGTDSAGTGNAIAALGPVAARALALELPGRDPRASSADEGPFSFVVHRRYNEEASTQLVIVPGLIGVILTMTMVLMISLSMTRERERGTMETLLSMPVRPLEVMIGKITPYVLVGAVQVAIVLAAAATVFRVPMGGNPWTLVAGTLLFVSVNLAIGFTFSTVARNQLQAMQMGIFFILPSILMTGFLFPFDGMPGWARFVGEGLPLTHYLRIVRGLLLKDAGLPALVPEMAALGLMLGVVTGLALLSYRRTLD